MKTKILLLASFTFITKIEAQISFLHTDLPSIGDSVFQIADTVSQPSLGNAGANQTWDFSTLVNNGQDTIVFANAASTPYASSFPTANVAVNQDGGYVYFNNSSTELGMLGAVGDPGFGIIAELRENPTNVFAQFPMNYADAYSNNHVELAIVPDLFGIPNVDSIKYENTVTSQVSVDAWGEVTTPEGTFSSLRQKETITSTAKIYGKNNQLNTWVLIQTNPTVHTNTYKWWSNQPGTGFPVVEIIFDIDLNKITSITYLNVNGGIVSLNTQVADNKVVSVYPNPTTDQLFVKGLKEKSSLSITDLTGKVVLTKMVNSNESLDVRFLSAGTYFYTISDLTGNVIATEKISIQK